MQAQADGGWLDASDFIATAIRLNLTGPLDLAVMRHALQFWSRARATWQSTCASSPLPTGLSATG